MSWGAKHPLVLKSQQLTPDGLKGKDLDLTPAQSARSMAEDARFMREIVGATRTSTVSFYKRYQLAVRLKQLDKRIAYWEAHAEQLELEAAQGGEK